MARPILLSNGSMHIGLNLYGEVHDFYYPHVGLENHAAAKSMRHHIGVFVDGRMSWLDDSSWHFSYNYHGNTLVGYIRAYNDDINITLEFDDCVDSDDDIFLRNIHVMNKTDRAREVRLFMHQVFDISDGAGNGDTAQYLPDSKAILHYRGRRSFVVGGIHEASGLPFDQYSIGLFGIEGHQGTYADAEDGNLEGNNVEHGRVDSTIRFSLFIEPHGSARVHYWIVAAKSQRPALDKNKELSEKGLLPRLLKTSKWWRDWIVPTEEWAKKLDPKWQNSFIKSTLLVKAQIDNGGAVMASTDTTMLNYSRDAYAYCWPRDAAYAVWPLIRLGYRDEPDAFFAFCQRVLHPKGYLMHKYQADGALGSSWHPYVHDGIVAPPIQEDETALTLYVFAQYYHHHKDEQLLARYYKNLVCPMANFLSTYINDVTGLPRPSYDLWEETFLTTTYTTAVVYGALLAAADLADAAEDATHAVSWRATADDMSRSAHKYLYNTERKAFYKGLRVINGEITYDGSLDISSVYGAFRFGLFEPTSMEITQSMATLRDQLGTQQKGVLGITRHENDTYGRVSDDIPGNPWFITTLWLAQYYHEIGQQDVAQEIVTWCQSKMLGPGVLSEQINPFTDAFVSVAPLTWSQAEYVSTLLDFNRSQ